jgi:hypothetical protein
MTAEERAKALCYGEDTGCEHTSTGLACHDCILAAPRSAEREAAAELEFYRDREKHIASLLKVADGGQYRADWNGAVERLKREAADEALERAAEAARTAKHSILIDEHFTAAERFGEYIASRILALKSPSSSPEGSR